MALPNWNNYAATGNATADAATTGGDASMGNDANGNATGDAMPQKAMPCHNGQGRPYTGIGETPQQALHFISAKS